MNSDSTSWQRVMSIRLRMAAVLLVGILGSAPLPTQAGIRTPLDMSPLASQASLIVVGRVLSLQVTGSKITVDYHGTPVQVQPVLASVQVLRTIKGTAPKPTLTVTVFEPDSDIGYELLGTGLVGTFFLTSEVGGAHGLVDPRCSFLPALPGAPQPLGSSTSDKVYAELRGVSVSVSCPSDLRADAIGLLAEQLDFQGAGRAVEILREVAADNSSAVRLDAAASLLLRHDLTVLPIVTAALSSPEDLDEGTVVALAASIRNGVSAPAALTPLLPLLSSANVEVRRGVVGALRGIGNEAVLPHLTIALADNDQEVRYDAMMGIAAFAEGTGDHIGKSPSMIVFAANESAYIEYWRHWVESR